VAKKKKKKKKETIKPFAKKQTFSKLRGTKMAKKKVGGTTAKKRGACGQRVRKGRPKSNGARAKVAKPEACSGTTIKGKGNKIRKPPEKGKAKERGERTEGPGHWGLRQS